MSKKKRPSPLGTKQPHAKPGPSGALPQSRQSLTLQAPVERGRIQPDEVGASHGSAYVLPIAMGAAALVFKLAYLWLYASRSPHYSVALLDSAVYVQWAETVAQEGWLGREVFYQAPLYPYLLSMVFRLFGTQLLPVYIIQALMGAAIVVLAHLAGRRVFGERAGWIGAVLCLFYAPFTFYEAKILTTVTEMLLAALFVYLLVRAEEEESIRWWAGGAVVLGLAILCRPNYLPVLPLAAMLYGVRLRKKLKAAGLRLALLCLIPSFMIGIVTARNAIVGKDLVLISSSGGITFAQGNNPAARGGMAPLAGFSGSAMEQRREEMALAEKAVGRSLKPSESSRYWYGRALAFIRDHPGDYAILLVRKLLLVLNNRELANNYLLSIDLELVPTLRLAFLPFGFIMAWAAVGLALAILGRKPATILVATFLGAFIMLLLFYVCTRFRMSLAPAAAVLAGGGLDAFLQSIRNPKRAAWLLLCAGCVWCLSLEPFLPLSTMELRRGDAEYWANLAVAYERTAQPDKAPWALDRAIELSPESYKYYRQKEALLKKQAGGEGELLKLARLMVAKFPHEAMAHLSLADVLAQRGSMRDAEDEYERAIELSPGLPEPYLRLGSLLGRRGEHQQARALFAGALEKSPGNALLRYNYGVACYAIGNKREARRILEGIAAEAPELEEARELLLRIVEER